MDKKKVVKETETGKKKNIIIGGTIIGILVILFFAWKLFINTKDTLNENPAENKMETESTYKFKKQGELSFISKGDKLISTIDIEIAENENTRALGLMNRSKMEEKQGMLFIFMFEEMQSFWMKNTILPLDILYLNTKKEIIKIHKNAVPFQEEPGYDSEKPAMYVVEVNAGYCEKYKIKEGDKIIFSRFKSDNL